VIAILLLITGSQLDPVVSSRCHLGWRQKDSTEASKCPDGVVALACTYKP
jgi:hypothetical protein